MSSASSGRRAPSMSSPGQKRAREEASDRSPSDPAKNPRRAFGSSPFADFGSYMAAKNIKLAAQFDADASTSGADAGGLFAGVSIFVDGFTVPSSQELKEIMLNNGGRFVNYFSRHTVTHIVCTNLPDSKMKNLSVQQGASCREAGMGGGFPGREPAPQLCSVSNKSE